MTVSNSEKKVNGYLLAFLLILPLFFYLTYIYVHSI
jgi:hypothetical protein